MPEIRQKYHRHARSRRIYGYGWEGFARGGVIINFTKHIPIQTTHTHTHSSFAFATRQLIVRFPMALRLPEQHDCVCVFLRVCASPASSIIIMYTIIIINIGCEQQRSCLWPANCDRITNEWFRPQGGRLSHMDRKFLLSVCDIFFICLLSYCHPNLEHMLQSECVYRCG